MPLQPAIRAMMNGIPRLGIGTWRMGEVASRADAEIAAIRASLEAGPTLIDCAELYGDGGAERVVARAIAGRRDACYLVSKVMPQNASRRGLRQACARSLQRLGTDRLDLYLLHWPGRHPLAETIQAFRDLVSEGRILRWGVSNFDVDDLADVVALAPGECAANQVYYSLSERGIEHALKPAADRAGIVTMAYCPLDGGALVGHPGLAALAARIGMTPARLALAWLLSRPMTSVIPMTTSAGRARDNAAATDVVLDAEVLAELDRLFPPPRKRVPLKIV